MEEAKREGRSNIPFYFPPSFCLFFPISAFRDARDFWLLWVGLNQTVAEVCTVTTNAPHIHPELVHVALCFPGDRFRAVIDDSWWAGMITDRSPYQPEFQDSYFQCFTVQ